MTAGLGFALVNHFGMTSLALVARGIVVVAGQFATFPRRGFAIAAIPYVGCGKPA